MLFAEGRRQQRLGVWVLFWGGGEAALCSFISASPSSEAKFSVPHNHTRLCEHAAAQARPNPQLHPPSAPLLWSIRAPGARQQPAGPRRAAGGDGSGGNSRHDPPSPRKPAPTAGPTQRGGCGSGRAAGPQSRGGRGPRAVGANKKTPQNKTPTKTPNQTNRKRKPPQRSPESGEAER